jgi:chromosome segregation ATPase
MLAERAPRLATLDESFDRLEALSADATQLRSTLRELANARTTDIAPETVATLNGLAERIDNRLGQVHAKVQSVRADVDALKVRIEKKKSRLLFVFNLIALLSTLMLAWIVYTQIVVLQYHWVRVRRPNQGS